MRVAGQRRGTVLLAALCRVFARTVRGQSIGTMLVSDVKNTAGDVWAVWTSPFHAGPKDWLTAGAASAGSAAVSPFDDDVDRWAVRHRNDGFFNVLDPVREGGAAFSGKTITPVAIGARVVSLAIKNQPIQEGLFGCVSAYVSTSAVRTFVVYPPVARTRPDSSRSTQPPAAQQGDQYKIDFSGSSDWGRHSLPGGHVANVAACTSFLTSRFSMGVVEPLLWTVVAGVGRTLDRRHWASDRVLGILYGIDAGRVVAIRSKHRANRANANGGHDDDDSLLNNVFVEPFPIVNNAFNIGWKYAF
jgi:membrane-associated phospholipid phosphatase